ncbi:unnamed protein product [Ranitomeya imitator]|uniref:UNC93-like protein MFSD11 n=1 Tax=Ranitomeya imitator TaxID=111125 RepID=A0ABN9KN54_9NEOB|nr:unnamed protein product [Ranitomeya imitator]
MGQKRDLTGSEKSKIVRCLAAGCSSLEIAKLLKRDHRTIKRFMANSQQGRKKRVGQKRGKITAHELRKIKHEAAKMPFATSFAIFQSCNVTRVTKSTRCAILRDMAKVLRSYQPWDRKLPWTTRGPRKASRTDCVSGADRKAEHSGDVTAVLCFTTSADSQCREADGGGRDRHRNVSFELTFYSGVFGTCIGAINWFGTDAKSLIGLSGIFVGLGEVLGGTIFGLLSKNGRFGRNPVFLLGLVVHFLAFYLIFLSVPNDAPVSSGDGTYSRAFVDPSKALAIFCSFLLGFGDSCFNTQLLSILGTLYADDSAPAFAIFRFVQDNARPHMAGVCQQFLQDEGIEAVDWPARSPDLNPIEHIWDIMSRTIHQRHVAPQTVQELADAFVQSICAAVAFFYSNYLLLQWQLLIMVIFGFFGTISFFFVEWGVVSLDAQETRYGSI